MSRVVIAVLAVLITGCKSGGDSKASADAAVDAVGEPDAGSSSPAASLSDARATAQDGAACAGTLSNRRCLVTIASRQIRPVSVVVDATNVYWETAGSFVFDGPPPSDGSVMKMPLAGSSGPIELAGKQLGPSSIAIDQTTVYWTNGVTSGTVMKVPKGGGTATTLASSLDGPDSIAVDAKSVYWATSKAIQKVPIRGGAPVTLAAKDDDPLSQLVVDAANVYWTDAERHTVSKMPLAGGKPITLASDQKSPRALALDGKALYFTNTLSSDLRNAESGSTIMTVPLLGSGQPTPPTTFASAQAYPLHIVVDASNVYWSTNDGAVMKAPRDGSTAPVAIVEGQRTVGGIAVDATSVYWTRIETGTVMRATPK